MGFFPGKLKKKAIPESWRFSGSCLERGSIIIDIVKADFVSLLSDILWCNYKKKLYKNIFENFIFVKKDIKY